MELTCKNISFLDYSRNFYTVFGTCFNYRTVVRTDYKGVNEVNIRIILEQAEVFHNIQKIAGCDTGFVISDNYLSIILANNYDPFEFTTNDMVKIDAQVSWLWSFFMEVEKTGWLLPHKKSGV